MMKRQIFFMFGILLFIACGGDDGENSPIGGNEFLNVSPLEISLAGNLTETTLSIQASDNCDWVISYSDPMIHNITPTKGRGSKNVIVQLYENPKTSERTAVITVKNTSGTISRNSTITQLGNAESLVLSETLLNFTSSAESKQISVSSNTHWAITGKTNWIILSSDSGDGNGTITISVQENTGNERSTILTFTGSEGKTQKLTIKQTGAAPTAMGVKSPQVSNIGKHDAEVSFSYSFDTLVTTYGVCYSTSGDPSVEKDAHVSEVGSSKQGNATMKLTNLSSGTTYYVRGYVVTAGGTQYSNSTSFTTESSSPGGDDNVTPGL